MNPTLDSANLHALLQETGVPQVLERLDQELIGLAPVKGRIREIAAYLVVDRLRRDLGLVASRPVLHMAFTGNPGTGKTTVALRMATILHRLGYIRRDHLVVATRDDLVGQYIGHTAPKTKEVLKRAMGGVLFIDEAYSLYRSENERDYGQETIEILLQVMENQREDLVVILAGYRDKMEQFFTLNPGMRSRIAHHITFPDYTQEELIQIGLLMIGEQNYYLDPAASQAFAEYVACRMQLPNFANARSIRNAIDRFKLRQARRLFERGGQVSTEDLRRIAEEDIRGSQVFAECEKLVSPQSGVELRKGEDHAP
ncbi:phosphoribulokinase/uridine kinase (plasmid) [Allomeiothermus silvanus DSM 9946]|uniref:Phosphoribulokinase/uridine kinase n=1 Tax=Allomeiothermus silvanus (strain ATCC 700542 / DSM 9946 / NBRC 106475 / NCIMB 13440 / VI-R2) TaxID=526227 RepID=D7BIR3_ALLS1|nr:CbbX protein [Allomeiothermus silvanus]ADH65069.1 phosphoribulokinase/uridine kinase [Allomeiothermus silvanus DSM 9946]